MILDVGLEFMELPFFEMEEKGWKTGGKLF